MKYLTNEQKIVVEAKLQQGYELLGKSDSTLNGLDNFILVKGRSTLAINSLGYDEHFYGKTWRIK